MPVPEHASVDELANFRRSPATVMRLARMGCAHQNRLSFMRSLLRRMQREHWQFARPVWQVDAHGVGYAVYTVSSPQSTYSLVAFAHDLPDELRSDRVIAEAWDATFALCDGVPDAADIARLAANVPQQEAGRISSKELCLSRANRSVRLFEQVVSALAAGKQPERAPLERVGYLMRTTAVYGAGKFGAADRDQIQQRADMLAPFRAEMLTVWLIRAFTLDLVEHLAAARGGEQAVVLEPDLRRCIGVGNSTGLGMAPFLINHPTLLHVWMAVREEALARVRAHPQAEADKVAAFCQFVQRARLNADEWDSQHARQQTRLTELRTDLSALAQQLRTFDFTQAYPWDKLYRWAEQYLTLEGQEQLVALLMEPYGECVDGLTRCMQIDELLLPVMDGLSTVQALREGLQTHYAWALALDFSAPVSRERFWYVSEEKLEPRLGARFQEPGAELEQPLCVGWHVAQLDEALAAWQPDALVAEFLLAKPEFRHVVRRVQCAPRFPYMEVRDNLIAADMLPIDLLRLKLSFFGATKFDPRSDRWVRITLFQHAPFPHEMAGMAGRAADDWVYPPLQAQV